MKVNTSEALRQFGLIYMNQRYKSDIHGSSADISNKLLI